MKKRRVDALNFKQGPTESGVIGPRRSVGGEIGTIDQLAVFLSQYGLLLLLLLVPFAFVLYKKRASILGSLARAQMALWRLAH